MLKFRLNPSNKIIQANSLREFVEKYRMGSFKPEESLEAFLLACSERAKLIGLSIRHSSPEDFIQDLMKEGFVTLETGDLPC